MRITKYGHACLLLEEGEVRILIDPGAFSKGFEGLTDLSAILITHQHQDHLVPGNIKALLGTNAGTKVYADEGSSEVLEKAGITAQTVRGGDEFEVAGMKVEGVGEDHAVIHPDIPGIPNVGYLVAERFFYPGDALTVPVKPVEVLAAPAGAPWLKISEAVDYVRAVKPRVAIPVHDAVLAMPGMNIGMLEELTKGQGVEVRVVENGQTTEF